MPAYKFLGIKTNDRNYKSAEVLIHGTDGEKTSFNDRLFMQVDVGADFIFDYSKDYPENPIKVITKDQIPGILKQDKEDRKAMEEAYKKKKAENIATGRFR